MINWNEVTLARLEKVIYADMDGDKQTINIIMEECCNE